jgi:hypothetical protein
MSERRWTAAIGEDAPAQPNDDPCAALGSARSQPTYRMRAGSTAESPESLYYAVAFFIPKRENGYPHWRQKREITFCTGKPCTPPRQLPYDAQAAAPLIRAPRLRPGPRPGAHLHPTAAGAQASLRADSESPRHTHLQVQWL